MKLEQFRTEKREKIKTKLDQADRVDQEPLAFGKVTRIYSAQEGHKTTDVADATFADALDKLLSTNKQGVKDEELQGLLNTEWQQLQRKNKIKRKYECQVKPATQSNDKKFP